MSIAISVKVLPATNTKPTRYKSYTNNGHAHTISGWDDEPCLYTKAAKELAMKNGFGGHWVGGGTKEGMVFVQVPNDVHAQQFHSAGW